MIERIGMERFVAETNSVVLHQDVVGAGQPRQLLAIDLPSDPDRRLVVVCVQCPSTGHKHVLRVPPAVRRCDEAVAWTFNIPFNEYQPLVER